MNHLIKICRFNSNNIKIVYRFIYSLSSLNCQKQLKNKRKSNYVKNCPNQIQLDIKKYLEPSNAELKNILHYNFSTAGKMIRPNIIILLASTINKHFKNFYSDYSLEKNEFIHTVNDQQYKIALIAEMIHTASLMHDDLIDCSNLRRGEVSSHCYFGADKAILGGDYILTRASQLLASIGNTEVVTIISQLIEDLIRGEIMQLTRYDNIDEKFSHYYKKTYRKTASLIANCCKAVALLSINKSQLSSIKLNNVELDMLFQNVIENAYEFGLNLGMTFQLIDDILDVTATQAQLGKPSLGTDMRLGLATGPVLFASQQFPEVNELIMRKLSQEGDFEKIMDYIDKADSVNSAKEEARRHHKISQKILNQFVDSIYKNELLQLSEDIFNRTK